MQEYKDVRTSTSTCTAAFTNRASLSCSHAWPHMRRFFQFLSPCLMSHRQGSSSSSSDSDSDNSSSSSSVSNNSSENSSSSSNSDWDAISAATVKVAAKSVKL